MRQNVIVDIHVQGTASDLGRQSISIQFLVWDEDHGRVVDEDGVVHCHVVMLRSDVDGTNEHILADNANPCANGVYVDPNTTITCIACLARGPALPRKQR